MRETTENDYPLDWILIESEPLDITDAERDRREDCDRLSGLRAAFLLVISAIGGVMLFGLACAAYFQGGAQ